MKLLIVVFLASIFAGCSADSGDSGDSEDFKLTCTDASGRTSLEVAFVDTGKQIVKLPVGGRLSALPILETTKTDSHINFTVDATQIKELAAQEGEAHRLEGVSYIVQLNRATLELSLQRYKDGQPYKKPSLPGKCELVENKI